VCAQHRQQLAVLETALSAVSQHATNVMLGGQCYHMYGMKKDIQLNMHVQIVSLLSHSPHAK
jgi:hypothetical protein